MAPHGFSRRRFLQTTSAVGTVGGALSLTTQATALTPPRQAPATPPARSGGSRTLTYTEGTNASATVSPDGKQLIIEVQGILWSLPRKGGTATRLTGDDLEPTRPAWSPDGTSVALCAYRGGGFHLWIMRPDGSRLRRLTDNSPHDDRGAAWSPDSTRVAFSSERGGDPVTGSPYRIWTVETHSGKLTRLSDPAGGDPVEDYDPVWSAHGHRVLFVRGSPHGDEQASGRTIMSVPADGGEARTEHTVESGSVVCPAVSTHGRIAYVHLTEGQSGPQAALEVDGTALTDGEDVFPVPPRWLSATELLYWADGRMRVRTVPAAAEKKDTDAGKGGGKPEEIPFHASLALPRPRYRDKTYEFDSTAAQRTHGIHQPALSPDGDAVVFTALNTLWLMRIGGRPHALVHGRKSRYPTMPSFNHAGSAVLYCTDDADDGLFAVRRHEIDGGKDTELVGGGRMNAALSPDGKQLAAQNNAGELFVTDLHSGKERGLVTPLGGGGLPSRPSWSPDGKYLAFCDRNQLNQRFREGYNLIRVVEVATGKAALYAPNGAHSLSDRAACGPVWSPDGHWMAYVLESALWVLPVHADGSPKGKPERLTDEAADEPSWAGDSHTLMYLSPHGLRTIGRDGSGRRDVHVELRHRRHVPPRSRELRIHAGRLWDGTSAHPSEDVDVVVHGNRIARVEPHSSSAKRHAQRFVDASEQTVIPGLWDSHTHPWQYTYGGRQSVLNLAFGVTTNVSCGGFPYEAVRLRESLTAGQLLGPRLFATGELLDGARVAYSMGRAHATHAGVRRSLSRASTLDWDFVKTYVRAPGWIMSEAARYAHHTLGVRSGSHLCYPGRNVGQDLTTHLQATQRLEYGHATTTLGRAYQDLRQEYQDGTFRMLATPFTAVPLLGAQPDLADDPRVNRLMPPWDLAAIQEQAGSKPTQAELTALRTEVDVYRKVTDEGGVIALGTDAPLVPVGLELHLALRGLRRYGFSAAEALTTATLRPAQVFGVADDLGTLERGKLADLAVVDGNPFDNFDDLIRISTVIRDGVPHHTTQLAEEYPAQHIAQDPAEGSPQTKQQSHDRDGWLDIARQLRRDACCTPHPARG